LSNLALFSTASFKSGFVDDETFLYICIFLELRKISYSIFYLKSYKNLVI